MYSRVTEPGTTGLLLSALRGVSFAVLALAAPGSSAGAQGCPTDLLLAPESTPGDCYGDGIAINGDRLAIGRSACAQSGAGSVHIYERGAGRWIESAEIAPPDPSAARLFGAQIALRGDTLLVGDAYLDAGLGYESGGVHVYQLVSGVWSFVQTLTASDGGAHDWFGADLALTDDEAFVSSTRAGIGGQLYVFDRSASWSETILSPPAGLVFPGSHFGASIAVDGDTLVAVAPAYFFSQSDLFLWERSNGVWSYAGVVTPGGKNARVSLEGNTMLVGCPTTSDTGIPDGEFFILEEIAGSWVAVQNERANIGSPKRFGTSPQLSGNRLVVSSYGDDGGSGLVQVWEKTGPTWVPATVFRAPIPTPWEFFGYSTALAGDDLFVATRRGLPWPGEVHVIELREFEENLCTSAANSTGFPAVIDSTACNSVAENTVRLTAGPVPDRPGLFFYGNSAVQVPLGNGTRCVGGRLARLPASVATAGILTWDVDLTQSSPAGTQITPGSSWYFQAWFRDPAAAGVRFGLSDSRRIEFLP